jgi:hypothetical protein
MNDRVVKMQAGMSVLDKLFNGDAEGLDKETGFILIVFDAEGSDRRCSVTWNRVDIRSQLDSILECLIGQADRPATCAKYDA